MAGLYVHIPFCNEKCFYCDFYSGNQLYLIESYVDALVKEIALRADYLVDNRINTIYFGGGTPSLLTDIHLKKILESIYLNFDVHLYPEITIECNPENISKNYLSKLVSIGINRISLGVQFLDDSVLKNFNRNHSKDLIFNALSLINNSSLTNLSVDLIYNVPDITDDYLLFSLKQLLCFDIKHFSAYSLTISKNSQLFWKIKNGTFIEDKEDIFLSQYKIIHDFLMESDYIQYEVSNYAKNGFLSVHNFSYWNQVPYLGVGVSAHSYNISSRQWNHNNIKKYIRELREDIISCDLEQLSDIQRYNEYIILNLRTFRGLSYMYVNKFFNSQFSYFVSKVEVLKFKGHFIFEGDVITPKESDLLIADYLAEILMF